MKYSLQIIAPLFLSLASELHGAGFQLQERSTSGQGRAFAGDAALAEDASAIANNPATLLLLDGFQVSSGFTFIVPDLKVSGRVGVFETKDKEAADPAIVPHIHLSHRISKGAAIGLSLHSRFGLSTDYSDDFLGSSFANLSEITTLYLSPKLAYQLNDQWGFGAGFDTIYVTGELVSSLPTLRRGVDIANVSGDDWAHGFHLGALYQASEKTHFGFAYHSQVNLHLKGTISGLITSTQGIPAQVQSRLPRSLEIAAAHTLSPQWTLHSNLSWTDWSSFDTLTTESSAGQVSVAQNWKDTLRVAIGATYKHNQKWTVRTGAAFDESPVRSAEFRTLRIPDSDRYWLSAGATYEINDCYSVDLAYSHIFSKTASLSDNSFRGEASSSAEIIGISVNVKF